MRACALLLLLLLLLSAAAEEEARTRAYFERSARARVLLLLLLLLCPQNRASSRRSSRSTRARGAALIVPTRFFGYGALPAIPEEAGRQPEGYGTAANALLLLSPAEARQLALLVPVSSRNARLAQK